MWPHYCLAEVTATFASARSHKRYIKRQNGGVAQVKKIYKNKKKNKEKTSVRVSYVNDVINIESVQQLNDMIETYLI